MCDLIRKCCSAGFDAAAACSAQNAPTAPSPYQKYDPAQGGACIAAIHGSASTCTATLRDYAGCQKLYVGTQAIGASCQYAEDCAGAAYCIVGDSPPTSQVCYPTAKVGEGCAGLYPSPAIGGAVLCGGGLYCDASSLCVPLAGLGQGCDPLYLSSSCDLSLRCDPASMKCTNKAPTGATCTADADCMDGNCSNGSIQTLMDYLRSGDRIADFLDDFPTVQREQVEAVLDVAGEAVTLYARSA